MGGRVLKNALVIHPYMTVYAGGEVVCLHVLNALHKAGYHTMLFSDVADVDEAMNFYPEVGGILKKVEHVRIPIHRKITLLPGMRMLDTARAERAVYRALEDIDCDVVFSTQSSIFTTNHDTKLIHFTYDFSDLFVFSPFTRMRDWRPDLEKLKMRTWQVYTEGRRLTRILVRRSFGVKKPEPSLIATPSSIILDELRRHGYGDSVTFVPPARNYTPLQKKRQVIQVARIVHAKRLEIYFEAAHRLPDVHFVLIARRQEGAMIYGTRLLEKIPSNVEFIEGNLKDHVDRLRESKVYCYTGRDRAIMLTVAEAISAGCYPIVSSDSAALDVANIARIGSSFSTISELVGKIRYFLDVDLDPWKIHGYAEPFKPEHFEKWIQEIAEPKVFS